MKSTLLILMVVVAGGCVATGDSIATEEPNAADLESFAKGAEDELEACIAALLPVDGEDALPHAWRDAFSLSLQQEAPPPVPEQVVAAGEAAWEFSARLFAWVPSLDGHLTARGNRSDIDLSVTEFGEAVWDNFSFAAMAAFELRRGDLFFDVGLIYLDLSADPEVETPLATLDFDLHLQILIAGGWVGYRFLDAPLGEGEDAPRLALSGVVGGTLWYVKAELDGPINDHEGSKTWFDPAVGLMADVVFSKELSLRLLGYVGGFGVGSDLAWGFQATLGWRPSDSFTLRAGWMILDSDYDDGSGNDRFEWDLRLSGPGLAAVFTF